MLRLPSSSTAFSRLAFFLFWPALALIVWGEITPYPPIVLLGVSDKLLHFTAYFGLAAFATCALRKPHAPLVAVLSLVALGGVLEILQGFIGRDAEWLDEAANTLGAVLGAFATLGFLQLVGRPRAV